MPRGPDARLVRDYLEEVGRQRGAVDEHFIRSVTLRLEQGGREYENNYRERELEALIGEPREEAADIAGWLALLLDRVFDMQREERLTPDDAQYLRMKIMGWAAIAQYLWRDMTDLLSWLDDPLERAKRNM